MRPERGVPAAAILVVGLAAAACSGRAEDAGGAPPRRGELPSAATGAIGAQVPGAVASAAPLATASPPAPSSASLPADAPGSSAWQTRCIEHVREAQRQAGAIEPEVLRASAKAERRDVAAGPTEVVSLFMFPPTFHTGGLGFSVERGGAASRRAPGVWQRRAEILGGYHLMAMRDAKAGHATVSFDGWPSSQVAQVAPFFEAAADKCLEDTAP